MTRPRLITALAVALFLRWLATGHVTITIARTAITVPALALAAIAVTATALAAAVALCISTRAGWQPPPPADDPDRSPEP